MYYAVGWPKKFSAGKTSGNNNIGPMVAIRASRERRVIAAMSNTLVCLWNHRVSIVLNGHVDHLHYQHYP